MPPRSPPQRTRPCYSHREYGTLHRFDSPHHDPAVRRKCPGRRFYSERCRREAYSVHRVTVYRWMKTCQPFSAALQRARAEFVLARRDDLHQLSNRALETLLAILDNPKSSPAVLLRTAMFILQRPQMPKAGWSMPEPAPNPDGEKLLDSAIIEQDYDSLPGLCNIERDDPVEMETPAESAAPAETPSETETPVDSATSEPPPPPETPVPPPPAG